MKRKAIPIAQFSICRGGKIKRIIKDNNLHMTWKDDQGLWGGKEQSQCDWMEEGVVLASTNWPDGGPRIIFVFIPCNDYCGLMIQKRNDKEKKMHVLCGLVSLALFYPRLCFLFVGVLEFSSSLRCGHLCSTSTFPANDGSLSPLLPPTSPTSPPPSPPSSMC